MKSPSKSPSKARLTTRSKNATTHPGDAIPKQVRQTKVQIEAAKEAQKTVKKKQQVERQRKLTNIAQAEDNIVLETQAQEASVPRACPKRQPLKRTYAMLDVTMTENEDQLATSDTGECSNIYMPSSKHSASEPIDPALDSADSHAASTGPPKKKRGRPTKKVSVLDEIQQRRQHLDPILEGSEDEGEEEDLTAPTKPHAVNLSQGLPFKAGLKKLWVAQQTGSNALTDVQSTAPKASTGKHGSTNRAAAKSKQGATDAKKRRSSAKSASVADEEDNLKLDIPKHPQVAQTQQLECPHPRLCPCPRPRPRLQALKELPPSQDHPPVPETPCPPSAPRQSGDAFQSTPLNIGGGIPSDDESGAEVKYIAAKSSPIKGSETRITSNAIVAICSAAQAGMYKPFPHAAPVKQAEKQAFVPSQSSSGMVRGGMARKPHMAAPTSANAKVTNSIQAPAITSASRKLQHNPKPSVPTPEGAESEIDEAELESTYDQASIAPSEGQGSHLGRSRRPPGAGHLPAATYKDLPFGATKETFKGVYIPMVAKYLGVLPADVWSTTSSKHICIFQSVWNKVFPQAPYSFLAALGVQCVVTRLICQRMYEWRAKFASAAIDAILDLEATCADYQDPDTHAEYVSWAIDENIWPFLYAQIEFYEDSDICEICEMSGTFELDIIMKALAWHLNFTADAIVVKKLRDLEAMPPAGALALATTGVEQALGLWANRELEGWHQLSKDSKPSLSTKFDFPAWGSKTEAWLKSIINIDTDLWEDIMCTIHEYVKPISHKGPASSAGRAPPGSVDLQAMIVACPKRK